MGRTYRKADPGRRRKAASWDDGTAFHLDDSHQATDGSAPPDKDYRRAGGEPDFTCRHCGRAVGSGATGTEHRNHCSYCLWSLHVDDTPGDRRSPCRSAMEPIGVWVRPTGEWAVIHRCCSCGKLSTNRVAGDDEPWVMMAIAARPLSRPPWPMD